MSNKNHSISLVFVGLLFFVATFGVFAEASVELEQAKSNVISLIQGGNYKEAEAQTQQLLVNFSEHEDIAKAVWEIAKEYERQEKCDEALEIHRYNVEKYPDYNDAHVMWSQVGVVYFCIRDSNDAAADEAVNKFLTTFSDQPTFPKEVWQIAKIYEEFNKNGKAFELYQYNVDKYPDYNDAHVMWSQVGIVYFCIRDGNDVAAADEAVNKFLTMFSEQPTFPKEVWQVAKIYEEFNKNGKAFQLHQYNVDHCSKDNMYTMWSQVEIIKSHIHDGNDTAADATFNKLLTEFYQQPTISKEIYEVAEEYDKQGRKDKADQLYQYVVNDFPGSTGEMWLKVSIVKLNIDLGNEDAAEEALDSLISDFNEHPDLPQLIFRIGEDCYYEAIRCENEGRDVEARDNFTEAVAVWRRIIAELPFSLYTKHSWYFTGVCYRRYLSDYEEALKHYQKVADEWPDYDYAWSAQYLIGECYERLKDSGKIPESEANPKIEQAYKAVVENYPNCCLVGNACLKLAQAYFEKGLWSDAAMYFEIFLQKAPTDQWRVTVLYNLGQAYEQMGELNLAAEVYRTFIRIADPDDWRIEKVQSRLQKIEGEQK